MCLTATACRCECMRVLAERLPEWSADTRQIPRGLLEFLPTRQRRQVLRARVPDVRLGQQRQDRLQGVPAGDQHHVVRETGAEARVGVQYVRRQRRRDDRTQRDVRNYWSTCISNYQLRNYSRGHFIARSYVTRCICHDTSVGLSHFRTGSKSW